MRTSSLPITATAALLLATCGGEEPAPTGPAATVFVGATLIDGTGSSPVPDAVLVVRGGRVEAAGSASEVRAPEGAREVDVRGRTIMPGLINTHGHVGDTRGLESGHYSEENVVRQLALYARYGVTTVNSLGGDGPEAIRVRAAQDDGGLDHARLLVAGAVIVATSPDEARAAVSANADLGVDFIKIRVDDNLGTTAKMTPDVYEAVIDEAHGRGLPVAAHVFYLDDAKALLAAGVDFIAHSVRDRAVDDELVAELKARDVCYCPTLTRELSTFVYGDVPEFFEDPFFLAEADEAVLAQLRDPVRKREVRESESAMRYRTALGVASANLARLAEAGVGIAFGTDSGPPARFQGYFEHLELELMAEAGLDPMTVLVSATGGAARCLGLDDVGTLEPGRWADFVVLSADPLVDVRNSKTVESVWIAGNRVPERAHEG